MKLLNVLLITIWSTAGCSGVVAQHDHHHASDSGLTATHAWTAATTDTETLVFIEIGNATSSDVILETITSPIASAAELVVVQNAGGQIGFVAVPHLRIGGNAELVLEPNVAAIRLSGLLDPIVEGTAFALTLQFSTVTLPVMVDVEPAGSTQHSHAGHHH